LRECIKWSFYLLFAKEVNPACLAIFATGTLLRPYPEGDFGCHRWVIGYTQNIPSRRNKP
jgi:hypothetical protein